MPRLVQRVDEEAEVVGRSVARGRRVVAGDLVAPRPVERVLHHRQQLDVREAERLHVLGEPRRDLAIGERAVAVLGHARPRAEVHLVDRASARAPGRASRRARIQRVVVPRVRVLGRRRSTPSAAPAPSCARTGRSSPAGCPSRVQQLELVERARVEPRDEQLEHAATRRAGASGRARPSQPQKSPTTLTRSRVRRPDRERDAAHAVHRPRVRAEHLPQPAVRPLVEQVQVDVADRRQEAVRIVALPGRAVGEDGSGGGSGSGASPAARRRRTARPRRAASSSASARRRRMHSTRTSPRDARRGSTTPESSPADAGCAPRMRCGESWSPASRRATSDGFGAGGAAARASRRSARRREFLRSASLRCLRLLVQRLSRRASASPVGRRSAAGRASRERRVSAFCLTTCAPACAVSSTTTQTPSPLGFGQLKRHSPSLGVQRAAAACRP